MGLEDVKDEIIQEAKQEKKQILEEAENKRQKLTEEAERKAESIKKETQEEIEEEKEALRKRTESNANMHAKNVKLEAKQKSIQKVFEDFREELEELSDEERSSFVENAVESVEFEVGEIHGSEEFRENVSGYEFTEIEDSGVVLISEDSERRVNYTFDKIVEDFREKYRKKIADELFE